MTPSDTPRMCFLCRTTTEELRPYGYQGAWLCFSCAMKPENKAQTEQQYLAQLDAAGPIAIIGEETGPRPLKRGDA